MVYAILIVIILALFIRLLMLYMEIKNIKSQVDDKLLVKTRKKLNISLFSKSLNSMCESVNELLEQNEETRIKLIKQEEQLKQSISNLSHDLRTPLTSILGYIQLIRNNREKTDEYLKIMENKATALNSLINEFYELSVLDDEDYSLDLERVDIVSVLTQSLMDNYELFEQKGIKADINLPNHAIYIISNNQALSRIFQNLVTNALKYSSGEVAVSLAISGNNRCVFSIKNSSEILTDDDVSRLFDRFYTADKSRNSGNTGLGLYIVKTLVNKLGGDISAYYLNGVFEINIGFAIV